MAKSKKQRLESWVKLKERFPSTSPAEARKERKLAAKKIVAKVVTKALPDGAVVDVLVAGNQPSHADKLARQLAILNVAKAPGEMDKPGWKLHQLIGRDAGRWSVWVNGNWRLTFKFVGEDAEVVDYQDYH